MDPLLTIKHSQFKMIHSSSSNHRHSKTIHSAHLHKLNSAPQANHKFLVIFCKCFLHFSQIHKAQINSILNDFTSFHVCQFISDHSVHHHNQMAPINSILFHHKWCSSFHLNHSTDLTKHKQKTLLHSNIMPNNGTQIQFSNHPVTPVDAQTIAPDWSLNWFTLILHNDTQNFEILISSPSEMAPDNGTFLHSNHKISISISIRNDA